MTQIVFPCKADYIKNIDENDDEPVINKPVFADYITKNYKRPNGFYHCFSYIFEEFTEYIFPWHFGVFVFYELIEVDGVVEKYYAAKAIVLLSKNPYYVLFKHILEDVYNRYLESENILPIELEIMNLYLKLSFKKTSNSKLIKFLDKEYYIENAMFLPIYDLNLSVFFNKFDFDDLLIIAEQFFKREPIIIRSDNIQYLYPTYFTIMNLLYPLNKTNTSDYYKYLVPSIYGNIIGSSIASFIVINAALSHDDIRKIVKQKQSNCLVIDLDSSDYIKLYEENGGIVYKDILKNKSIIKLICEDYNEHDIKITQFLEDNIPKLRDDNTSYSIFDIFKNKLEKSYFDMGNYQHYNLCCEIRKQLFSLFTKFLTFHLPYTYFDLEKDKKKNYEIYIKLDDKSFLGTLKDIKKDHLFQFYDNFITTPSFNAIFQKCRHNDPNLKNYIILDELIKIIKYDNSRLYFDHCFAFSQIECINGKINITNKTNQDEIVIKEHDIYLNLGSMHNVFHVYNLVDVKNKRNGLITFTLNKIGQNKVGQEKEIETYTIKYHYFNLYFQHFNYFLYHDDICTKLKQLKLDNSNDGFSILLYEIQVFLHLIETKTLHLESILEVSKITLILLLCIEILSINDYEIQFKKFKFVMELFDNCNTYIDRYSFILSLIYEVVYKIPQLREVYEIEFIKKLQEYKILPTFNIFIKFNSEKKGNNNNNNNNDIIVNKNKNKLNSKLKDLDIIDVECVDNNSNVHVLQENRLDFIRPTSMSDVQCVQCNRNDSYLFLYAVVHEFEEISPDIIIHPMIILVHILEEVVKNNGFRMNLDILFVNLESNLKILIFYLKELGLDISVIFDI